MVHGFWLKSEGNNSVCQALPKEYDDWIKKYNFPTGTTHIHTLDERSFEVKVMKLGHKWFFYNGWKHMITTLNYPGGCNFVFEYEDMLHSFRMITFHQDAISAPGKFFYCKLDDPLNDENRLHISCFVHHGLYNRQPPMEPIMVSSFPGHVFHIQLQDDGDDVFISQGWPYMKEIFEITKDTLIVFEIYQQRSYELSFFKKDKLTLAPDEWEDDDQHEDDDKVKDEDIIVVSDGGGEEESQGVEYSDGDEDSDVDEDSEGDDEIHGDDMEVQDDVVPSLEDVWNSEGWPVPVAFVVDNKFRMKATWARENGLNRSRGLTIKDGEGYTWGVSVGIEDRGTSKRYSLKGMAPFVADKGLQKGDHIHFLWFEKQGLFKLSKVVRVDGS